jgi:hypothetical protein
MSTITVGYVLDGKNKKFQNYKCKYASNCWIMGIF